MPEIFCWNCGKSIPEKSVFCKFCGKKTNRGDTNNSDEIESDNEIFDPEFDDTRFWDMVQEELNETEDPDCWKSVLNDDFLRWDSTLAIDIYERPFLREFSLACAYNAVAKMEKFVPILITDHILIAQKKFSAFSSGLRAIMAARDTPEGCEVLVGVGRMEVELFGGKRNKAVLEEIVNAWIEEEVAEAKRLLAELENEA